MGDPIAAEDRAFLARMNRLSVERSFDPEIDIDWAAGTTDEEFLALYGAWSLLAGSGKDEGLDARARVDFARYQQANLMLFTAFLERYGLRALQKLYDYEDDLAVIEAVGHFVKEETFHHTMFMRAVAALEAAMPQRPKLPRRHVQFLLHSIFVLLALVPFRRLRVSVSFMFLQFAEEISIVAHNVSARAVSRKDSVVPRIWALHALDEARHLSFDAFVRRRYRLSRPAGFLARSAAVFLAVLGSLLLNAGDVWAARQVGARVSLWHIPLLVKKTTAPFKRSVFATITRLLARPNG